MNTPQITAKKQLLAAVLITHPAFIGVEPTEIADNERKQWVKIQARDGATVRVVFIATLPDTDLTPQEWATRHAAILLFSNVPQLYGKSWTEAGTKLIHFTRNYEA